MNPHSKPRPLFFTPRSPWGRLPLKHAHQSHMRASEGAPPPGQKRRSIFGKIGHWIHEHVSVDAHGEKEHRGKPGGEVNVEIDSNKRVAEDQRKWDATYPSHAFPSKDYGG